MKQRIFLTHIVPKGEEIKNRASIAACNFSRNLISGGLFDKVYSIPSVYIHRTFENESDVTYVCSRTRYWGRFFYKIAPILEQIFLFFKITRNTRLWIYNLTPLSVILYLLLNIFKPKVKVYIIVLDFTPNTKFNKILLRLINSSNGLITLSNSKLFNNKNRYCIPGVIPNNTQEWPLVKIPIEKKFLLSGVMTEQISQISKVLKVFADNPQYELHITGMISNNNLLKLYKQYSNIKYHGVVSWIEYLELLHLCPFLLSTRDAKAPENLCNFPSKIIESLLHNRIIISTLKYDQLNDIKILNIGNDIEEMKCDLENIGNTSDEDLLIYANQSTRIKEMFNISIWDIIMSKIENY